MLSTPPTVTTQAVTGIAITTATGNGNITSLGSSDPTAYGVCWNTTGTPTISGSKVNKGSASATGAFTASMTSLSANTTYHVRAYATNTTGTSYGAEVTFTTSSAPSTVTTQAVSSITSTTATGNGDITGLGVPSPTAHGICWNTTGTPTTSDSKVDHGAVSATGAFTAAMTSLSANTTYHVRAYATNTAGTSYGAEVTFTTSTIPTIADVAPPTGGTYASGQNLDFTATFTKSAVVTGTPYLTLTVGGTSVHAPYESGSGSSAITFRYTVASGDYDVDGVVLASEISLGGGTIKDAEGNAAALIFAGSTVAGVLVDARPSQTITFGTLMTQTYGTAFVKLAAAASSGLPVSYASANPEAVRISNDTAYLLAVDTATITASQAGNASYVASVSVSRIMTVAKKGLTITGAVASGKVYDGTVSASVTGVALSGVENSDDVSLVLGTASFASKDVGPSQAVTVTGSSLMGAKADNYSLTEVAGLAADITAKPVFVTADAKNKVYGSSDPALTYTASALVSGDDFTGSLSRAAGDAAGSYAIGQGTLSAGGNYSVSYTGSDLTVTKKPLSIKSAVASGKVYDGTVSASVTGAALSGVENSDDVSLVLGTASFASKDVGPSQAVTVTGSSLMGAKADNYSLTEVAGLAADITARTVSVTADAKNKELDAPDPALTYVASGLLSGDVFTGALSRVAGEQAGRYAIGQGTLNAGGNYEIVFTGADLVVQVSSAVLSRPVQKSVSNELDAIVGKVFSVAASEGGEGRMGASGCREDNSCLSVEVIMPGSAKVAVAIFDNLGTPVIAFDRIVSRSDFRSLVATGDGRRILPVSWNLRSSDGTPVRNGVYLWKIAVESDDGQNLVTVKRLGVRQR